MRLLLQDGCPAGDPLAVGDVADAQLHQIASALFAVDAEAEQHQLPRGSLSESVPIDKWARLVPRSTLSSAGRLTKFAMKRSDQSPRLLLSAGES